MIKNFLKRILIVNIIVFIIINFKQIKIYAKYVVNSKETIIQIQNADNENPTINGMNQDFYNQRFSENVIINYDDNLKVKYAKYWFNSEKNNFNGEGTDFESGTEFKNSGWYKIKVEDFYNNDTIYVFLIDKEFNNIDFSASLADDNGAIFTITATDKLVGVSEINVYINDNLYKTYTYSKLFAKSYTEILEVPIKDLPFYENCYIVAKDFLGNSMKSNLVVPNTSRIYNLKDLVKFRDMVNSNSKTFNGKDIFLLNDLNMYDTCHEGFNSWTPIGSKFQGIFMVMDILFQIYT